MFPGSAVNAARILYRSFSSAGWFCKFGRRADSRPVSVFKFNEQCTRPRGSAFENSWRGRIKFASIVSIEPTSQRLAIASHASTPSSSSAKSAFALPKIGSSAKGCPASSLRTDPATEGHPPAVKCEAGRPSPEITKSRFFFGVASGVAGSTHCSTFSPVKMRARGSSVASAAMERSSSTPPDPLLSPPAAPCSCAAAAAASSACCARAPFLPRPFPFLLFWHGANKSCRTCASLDMFIRSAPTQTCIAQDRNDVSFSIRSCFARVSTSARWDDSTKIPSRSMSVRRLPKGTKYAS